jgi:hypothetical protein
MIYEDFELLATDIEIIKENNKKQVRFHLNVPRSPAGELIEKISAEYDALQIRECLKFREGGDSEWPEVLRLGDLLGKALFPQPVRDLLVRSLDLTKARGKGLRIRLLLEGELNNIPWEYVLLNRGGGKVTVMDLLGLMPDVSIVRHQAATIPFWSIKAELPAQMVAAFSSPAGYAPLNIDQERKIIEQAIQSNINIKLHSVDQATLDNLLAGVNQAHFFHFSGHGDVRKKTLSRTTNIEDEGFIVLEDHYGDPILLKASDLALQLRQVGVRVALLGACHSGGRDITNKWDGIAATLLKAELGAVVGMQDTILDQSAIAFTTAFYKALVAGLPIDDAVNGGRLTIARTSPRDWAVPVLYLRAPDGVVFPEYSGNPTLKQDRENLCISIQQQVKELSGTLVGITVNVIEQGNIIVEQKIEQINNGGSATGVEAGNIRGGRVNTNQNINSVKKGGTVTGVKLDKI